ncbi:MAG: tetratricopeptide repeat protein [Candidatus Omnitrophica bacterium]|nr:tetratricopeptide repeat protein [Candidatus Omnitrophota bacterium]
MTAKRDFLASVSPFFLLALLALAAYSNSFGCSFQFDDSLYVVNNPSIHYFNSPDKVWRILKEPTRFLSLYSFALNYRFNRLDVFGYHLFNFILHLINSFLVFWLTNLLYQLFSSKTNKHSRSVASAGIFVSILFLVHPLQTQAVTYISQRMASLAALFYFLSIISYIKARIGEERTFSGVFFIVSILSAIAGMLSKETVFTLPFVILIFENLYTRYLGKKTFLRNKIFWAALITSVLVIPLCYSLDFKSVFGVEIPSASHDGDTVTFANYFLTQFRVIMRYISLIIFPVNQNLDYDFALSRDIFSKGTLISILAVIGLLIYGISRLRKNAVIYFGMMWFFVALSVESSIFPIRHVIFEHRLYLPSFGIILALFEILRVNIGEKKMFNIIFSLMVLTLAFLTFQRNRIWQDELTMWRDVARKSPNKARAYSGLGDAYLRQKDYNPAVENFDKALKLNPKDYKVYNALGVIYSQQGQRELAVENYQKSMQLAPLYEESFMNLGNLYFREGYYNQALELYSKVINFSYNYPPAYLNRGILLSELRRYELAREDFNKAIYLRPYYTEAYINRGNLSGKEGRYDEAIKDFDAAIKLDPFYPQAYISRGNAYELKGQSKKAEKDYETASKLGKGKYNVKKSN